jgi:hypothetical protein
MPTTSAEKSPAGASRHKWQIPMQGGWPLRTHTTPGARRRTGPGDAFAPAAPAQGAWRAGGGMAGRQGAQDGRFIWQDVGWALM